MATGLITLPISFAMKAGGAGVILSKLLAKGGGVALINAITKGSADAAAEGDRQISLQDREDFLIDIDVNESALLGTAIVGGSMYGMLTYRFYLKMKMGERLALATPYLNKIATKLTAIQLNMELIERFGVDIAKGMDEATYLTRLNQFTSSTAIITNRRNELDYYLLLLDHLNKVDPLETNIDDMMRKGGITAAQRVEAEAVIAITQSTRFGLSPDDLGALKQLTSVDDTMGIKKTLNTVMAYLEVMDGAIYEAKRFENDLMGLKLQGTGNIVSSVKAKALGGKVANNVSMAVVKGAEQIGELTPRLVSVVAATESVSAAAGGASKLAVAGKWVGRGVAKVLWIDTVIWGATLGIDLGLNLFMTEEEQANIPVIGFLFEGAGWSPLGWAIEGVIDFFVEPETQQDLFDVFVSTLIAASQEDNIGNAMLMILDFYIDNVSINLLVPLSFPQDFTFEDDLSFNFIPAVDPMIFLEVGIYAIAAKLVFTHWLFPMWGYFIDGLWGNPSATT